MLCHEAACTHLRTRYIAIAFDGGFLSDCRQESLSDVLEVFFPGRLSRCGSKGHS